MRNYTFYVEDERYSAPTVFFVVVRDEDAARHQAQKKLKEPHHLSVEVRENDRFLFRLDGAKSEQVVDRSASI